MQRIYPAINCNDGACFAQRIHDASTFLEKGSWLHIDISDPAYSHIRSFVSKEVLHQWGSIFLFEAHCMIPWQRVLDEQWFELGCKRLLFHIDVVQDWEAVLKKGAEHDIEIGVVIQHKKEIPHIPEEIQTIEVLAVPPGPSGQSFDTDALSTISALRTTRSGGILLVDGGVDTKTGMLAKEAGADVLIAGSFIWGAPNPQEAYQALEKLF
jgi:ribulose-phosphate 3-epimerase